jgi:Ca2+-binding EF-hand superfamily protein
MGRAMKGRIVTTSLSGLCIASTLCGACSEASITPFSELDRNRDGRIDAEEARDDSALHKMFNEVDGDRDGQLTAVEYLNAVHRL